MKSLSQHIEEKLIINKNYQNDVITPKNRKDLEKIIHDRYVKNPYELDLNDVDITEVGNSLCELFGKLDKVKKIHIENWDVSNIEDMSFMFWKCLNLRELDLSSWVPSKELWDLNHMFSECDTLEDLELFDCNWEKKRVNYMFQRCIPVIMPEWYDQYTDNYIGK